MDKLFASLLILFTLTLCSSAFADPNCISAYGKTACGYNCKAAYGEIKCAQTPQGTCQAAYGEIVCYDPPRPNHGGGRGHGGYGEEAKCVSAYGTTVCGYNCVSAYGEVKCSQTPNGACKAAYGNVICYDPPRRYREKAECVAAYGDIRCGYHCVSAYGDIKCANTPSGICQASSGSITCWDP